MTLITRDRRARILLAGALVAGALGLTEARADAAYTPTVKDRTLLLAGDAAGDKLALRTAATRLPTLEADVGDDGSADFRIALSRFDRIRVLAGDGADAVRVQNVPLAVTIDGGAGFDALSFDGSGADEQFRLAPDGARARLTRGVGAIAIDADAIERVELDTLGGADNVTLDDLTGTGVQEFRVDLEAVRDGGAPDTAADKVILNGSGNADLISVLGGGTGPTSVLGLPTFVSIQRGDPTRDELTVNTLAGNDRVDSSSLTALKLVADGGVGDDTLSGTNAADTLIGGEGRDFVDGQHGADVALLGAGDDTVSWSAGDGSDVVEGQAGVDALMMNGSAAGERFEASAAGGRMRVARSNGNGAEVVDTGGTERLSEFSFGGADTLVVNDLTGTALTSIDASLFDFAVPGGAQDVVVVNGSAAKETITAASDSGIVNVTGIPARIRLTGTDAAGDRLEVNGVGGDDTIDSTGLAGAEMLVRADGGAGNDVLLGGDGDDVLSGGDGADVVFAGSGDNVAFGGAGDDVLRGEEGDDVLDGGAGDDILIGNAGDDILLNGEVVFDE